MFITCDVCKGAGRVFGANCECCDGKGELSNCYQETMEVRRGNYFAPHLLTTTDSIDNFAASLGATRFVHRFKGGAYLGRDFFNQKGELICFSVSERKVQGYAINTPDTKSA